MGFGASLILCTLAASGSPSAKAAKPTVLVIGIAGDDTDRSTAVTAMVAESVVRRFDDKFSLIEPFDPDGEKKRAAAYAEAKRYIAAAESLYSDLDLATSAASADTAAQKMELTNLALHFGDLVRARMLQIRALVGNSEEKPARAASDRLLTVDPRADFDPKQFPPEFLSWVNQRRDEVRAKSDMAIEIRAQVPARVYIDGIYRGIAPVEVKKLSPGDHYITLVAPGYKLRQYKAHAGSSETVDLVPGDRLAELNQHLTALKANLGDESARDKTLRDMGRAFGASQVLFITLSRQSKKVLSALALRLAVEDGHYLAYVEEALPDGDETKLTASGGAFVERALNTDAPRIEGKAVTSHGGGGLHINFSLDRRTGGFVAGGAGVGFVALGAIFGILALNQSAAFHNTPQTSAEAPKIAATGHTFALVADISYLVGLVGLGGGGYLLFGPGAQHTEAASATSERPAEPKPQAVPERPPERPVERPTERTSPRPAPEKPSLETTKAPSKREPLPEPPPPTAKPPPEKPAPVAKPAEKPPEKPAEKPAEKPKPKPPDGETFDDLRDDR